MPLTPKGEEILSSMEKSYGPEKAERVLYASQNAGTISGIDAMDQEPEADMLMQQDQKDSEDCADQSLPPAGTGGMPTEAGAIPMGIDTCDVLDQEGMLHPPSLLPEPDLEHPQQHPDTSAPPEAARSGDRLFADLIADLNGGITGGATPQHWGNSPRDWGTGDALPSGCSLDDIIKDNAGFWGAQFGKRPLGPDTK